MASILGPCLAGGSRRISDALAGRLQELVEAGDVAPGTRLPTHRALAEALEIAPGTVQRAYHKAARLGMVRSHVGAGTFVVGPRAGGEPAREHRLVESGAGADTDLALNAPVDVGQDGALAATLAELGRRPSELSTLLRYQEESGRHDHRQSAARWLRELGVECRASDVVITGGVQHGLLCTLMAHLRPGDVIAAERHTYPGLIAAARYLGLALKVVDSDEEGMRPDALEAFCRDTATRAIYLTPTVQNPTTTVMSEVRRRELAAVVGRERLLLIEDEVHAPLVQVRPPTLQSLAPARTVYLSSASKAIASGLRVGFAVAPGPVSRSATLSAVRSSCWVAAPLLAEIAARWIADGTAERLVRAQRTEIRRRKAVVTDLVAGLDARTHEDAFHYWFPLGGELSADEVRDLLKQQGVRVLDAGAFAVDPAGAAVAVRASVSGARSDAELRRGFGLIVAVLSDVAAPTGLVTM